MSQQFLIPFNKQIHRTMPTTYARLSSVARVDKVEANNPSTVTPSPSWLDRAGKMKGPTQERRTALLRDGGWQAPSTGCSGLLCAYAEI